jgi:predicted DNA binding CopG/RHH family protein
MPRKKAVKGIPRFENEDAEREFWARHDSSDYVDWSKVQSARLPSLKLSTKSISIRLPEALIEDLKVLANKRDIPYQSLLKLYVAERVEHELREG